MTNEAKLKKVFGEDSVKVIRNYYNGKVFTASLNENFTKRLCSWLDEEYEAPKEDNEWVVWTISMRNS